ncbi:MAG: lyase family protein, partial [Rhodoglobus sp.]|nr:lyase family protein [Rhodoglobus sp.]
MMSLPDQPLSPLDGRYRAAVSELGEHLSEAALNRARVRVEVEWLLYLTEHELFGSTRLNHEQARELRRLAAEFGQAEIDELATLEATTRHDVKAVEYLVRRKLTDLGLNSIAELTHFACTSEDINNLSYAATIQAAIREVWLPKFREVIAVLRARAIELRDDAMLAHTHGQPATPTTMGKELGVFVYRLDRILAQVES